jgi:hypothetical protein
VPLLDAHVVAAYAEAGLDPRGLGIAVDHHKGADGSWSATVDLADFVLLAYLATRTPPWPSPRAIDTRRPKEAA